MMSPRQRTLLIELNECPRGKGYMLNDIERRIAGPLISDGLVDWIGFGSVRIYRITDKGRDWVKANVEEAP